MDCPRRRERVTSGGGARWRAAADKGGETLGNKTKEIEKRLEKTRQDNIKKNSRKGGLDRVLVTFDFRCRQGWKT